MDVYYYIDKNEKDDILDCGIKLSVKSDRKVPVGGYPTSCISTLLNPKDDLTRYDSKEHICLRLDLKPNYCYIADRTLYGSQKTLELYNRSVIPAADYIFGTFRQPECLVTCTILPESINVLNKAIDCPILYTSSEELYIQRLISEFRDKYDNFDEAVLQLFLSHLTGSGKFSRIEDRGMDIFVGKDGEVYTIKTGV